MGLPNCGEVPEENLLHFFSGTGVQALGGPLPRPWRF